MTLSTSALLDELGGRGVRLYVKDGQLRAVAGRAAMTSETRQLIETHREELITALSRRAGGHLAAAPAPPGVRLTTERLVIRPLRKGDESDVLAYRGRPDVFRYLRNEPLTAAAVGRFVAEESSAIRLDRDDDGALLAVELDGRVIGDVSMHRGRLTDRQADIGWVFNPEHQGHGYATEAARASIAWGASAAGLRRITSVIEPANRRSRAVAERLGMTYDRPVVVRGVSADLYARPLGSDLAFEHRRG